MRRTETLRIRYTLHTPVLLNHPWIHFDGLVAHLLLREHLGDKIYTLDTRRPSMELLESIDIPIARVCTGNTCFYDASISMFDGRLPPWEAVYPAHVRKRFTERYAHTVATARAKLDVSRGPFKLFDIEYTYVPARTVEFIVRGDEQELTRIAARATVLGAKRGEGWGHVKGFTYEKLEQPRAYQMPDGTVTRPIPVQPFVDLAGTLEAYGHATVIVSTYAPPYWDRSRAAPCTVPGMRYVVVEK